MIRGYTFPYQQSADPIQPDPALLKWKPEDNQPPRRTVLALALLAGFAFVAEPSDLTPAETVTLDKWHQPLSEPARPVPALHAALQQAITTDPEGLTQPEDVKVTSWLDPLAEPQPAPRLVPEGAFGYVADVETPDVTWLRRLDEPTLPTPHVAYQQETTADPEAFAQPEAPQLDKWHRALSEPVRSLSTVAYQLEISRDLTVPAVADTSEDEWPGSYRQFATPVRVSPRAVTFPQAAFVEDFAPPTVAEAIEWLTPFNEPPAPAARVAYQQALAIDPEALTLPSPPPGVKKRRRRGLYRKLGAFN